MRAFETRAGGSTGRCGNASIAPPSGPFGMAYAWHRTGRGLRRDRLGRRLARRNLPAPSGPPAPLEPKRVIVFTAERWQLILLSASVTIPLVSLIAVVLLIVRHGIVA
jgi:hypothetical protein